MASKTEDQIANLTKLTGEIHVQLKNLQDSLNALAAEHAATVKALGEVTTNAPLIKHQIAQLEAWKSSLGTLSTMDTRIALLEQLAKDFKEWKDETKKAEEEKWRKLWMIVPPVLTAILGCILTAVVNHFLK